MTVWHSRTCVILLLLCGMVGCAVEHGAIYTQDGTAYGKVSGLWRGTWWQHYQRGVSYTDGGFWNEAMASLAAALTSKQGQQDRRRINTYGVHFLNNYFPHRELGIVFYHLGRYDDARRELETSLSTVETAKAKFFLNKVRTSLLQQARQETAPPRLFLEGPFEGLLTKQVTIDVRGRAEAEGYVAALTINGQPQLIELAERHLPFAQQVALHDGPNLLEIIATDLLGHQTRHRVTVHLDRHGPLVSLEQVEMLGTAPHQRVRVQGFVSDQSPLKRFVMAGRQVVLPQGPEADFHQEVVLLPDTTSLPLEVEDAAGNVTRGEIALDAPGSGPRRTRQGKVEPPQFSRWASLASERVVSDIPVVAAAQMSPCEPERDPPIIKLRSPEDRAIVYNKTVYLEVMVTGSSDISAFSIEGEPLLRRQGRQLFFAYLARLQLQRDNGFLLEARDACGRRAQREIMVRHRVPKAEELVVRLRVALESFQQQEGCKSDRLTTLMDDYLQRTLAQHGRFRLQKNLAETEGLIAGLLCVRDTPSASKSLEIIAHFFDMEPSKPDFPQLTEDVYGEDLTGPEDVRTLIAGLTVKLLRHFPLEQGNVLDRDGLQVLTSLTRMQGVRPRMKLLVFRTAHEQSILAEARITDISGVSSWATMLASGASWNVQKNDQVIPK